MAIEKIAITFLDNDRVEVEVGTYGIQWIAVDSNSITIDRDAFTQVVPLTSVRGYVIYKKGYTND